MAGRRHHYLPQLIQRPFAYRKQGKEFYVHAYHRTRCAFTPNTNGLGKELDFYGGPDDTSLDDAITRGEDALAFTVQRINQDIKVATLDMATLVCALAFRTKSMRQAFVRAFPALLAVLRARLLETTQFRQYLIASLTDPKECKRLIYEQIDKHMGPLPREKRAKAYGTLLPRWKTYVFEQQEQLVAESFQMVCMMLAKARAEANIIADGAYLRALAKDPTMPIRASRMATEMTFEILNASSGEFFILGDCGPVAIFTDGKPRLALAAFDNDVEISAVFLPSSPTRCVVGRLSSVKTHLSVEEINRISASLSLEFFISNRGMSKDLEELRALIGSLVPIDTEEDIIRTLSQLND